MTKIRASLFTLAALLALQGPSALAGWGDLPWSELEKAASEYRIDIRWPLAGGYEVKALCAAGDELRTRTPVRVCTEWKDVTRRGNLYDGRRFECVNWVTRIDTFSRTVTRNECVDLFYPRPSPTYSGPVCRRYEDVTRVTPLSFAVEIRSFRTDDRDDALLATKTFDIPACQ